MTLVVLVGLQIWLIGPVNPVACEDLAYGLNLYDGLSAHCEYLRDI